MKKSKIILLYSIVIITILYLLLNLFLIDHKSSITNENEFNGIVSDYLIDGNQIKIYFKDKEKLIGIYYINSIVEKEYFINNLKYGSTISIKGETYTPNNNTIPNTFNYKNYLYYKGIYKLININNITINNDNISFINNIKNGINNNIRDNENYDYLKAFILGNKNIIDKEEYSNFQKLGISHLFAISGMHISFFILVISYIFKIIKINNNIISIILILFIGFYGILVSFPSSIKRAYIFFILISLNKLFKLNISTIKLLIICICINILIEPFIIFDIGFLYSISTTYGLLLSSKFINKGNYIIKLLKISTIAYLFSLPITINNNYEINLLSPINNIIIVPLISFIIYPLSIITLFINNKLFNYSINIFNIINNILIKINILNIIIPNMSIFIIITYYIFLVLSITKSKKYLYIIIIITMINIIIPKLDNTKYIYYLDVGQGDSILLIESYQKDVTMIDTGGKVVFTNEKWKERNSNYRLIDNTILFFKSIGITHINNLILTHGDYDHMGEAINLVNNFKVEKVIFNCGEFNDLEKEFIKVLDKKKIKYYSCIKELNLENNKLYFLQTGEYNNENDNSNVIYTELNGYKFMFMGDAGVEKEKDILDKYNINDIDVLKVGHHGSRTSSSEEFIDEINPKYSIISVGKNNRYGHPNKEVLNALDNSKIYRTDQDGSIMFKIKNNKLYINTCEP